MDNPETVFVLGGPGAGKGTQCEFISKEYMIPHISAGDCLREEQANPNSPYSKLIDDCIRNGSIVPVKITLTLLLRKMLLAGFRGMFLIDGFPRNIDNLCGWLTMTRKENLPSVIARIAKDYSSDEALRVSCESVLERLGMGCGIGVEGCEGVVEVGGKSMDELREELSLHIDSYGIYPRLVLYLECTEDEMVKRILKRSITSGRSDDNEQSLRKRFLTFKHSTLPIIHLFQNIHRAHTVNANQTIPQIFHELKHIFEPFKHTQIAALSIQ